MRCRSQLVGLLYYYHPLWSAASQVDISKPEEGERVTSQLVRKCCL
jgi:hypothetical protein